MISCKCNLVCSCLNSYCTFFIFSHFCCFFFKYVAFCTGFNLLTPIFMLPYITMDLSIFEINVRYLTLSFLVLHVHTLKTIRYKPFWSYNYFKILLTASWFQSSHFIHCTFHYDILGLFN